MGKFVINLLFIVLVISTSAYAHEKVDRTDELINDDYIPDSSLDTNSNIPTSDKVTDSDAPKQDFFVTPFAGYRYDQFMWSVSNGTGSKLSELTWKNKLAEAGLQVYTTPENQQLNFLGYVKYGIILNNSTNQDSDWDSLGEHSRTFSKVKGSVFEASGALGYSQLLSKTLLTYYFGLEFSRVHLRDYGLNYTINRVRNDNVNLPLGQLSPKSILNSTYTFDNYAPWIGASFCYKINDQFTFTQLVKLYFFSFKGKAQWLLRDDFRHDTSFMHRAYGLGIGLDSKFSYIASKDLEISAHIGAKKFTMSNGTATYYLSDGMSGSSRLRDLSLFSGSIALGISYKL